MAREWTKSQNDAMNIRGKMILVSAAAGSGKTSVLTERIIRTLTDREHPADLSRILVVTFTRAAAAELKSRIASALTDALAEHPGDAHLSRQLFLLGSAQISTIDSFFQQAVRANFEQLDLPASFRMADGNELASLSLEVFDGAIRELYDRYQSPEAPASSPFSSLTGNRFAKVMDNLMSHRSDKELDRKLLDFYKGFSSYPEGIAMLSHMADDLRTQANGEFFDSAYGKSICSYLQDAFAYFQSELKAAGDYLAGDEKSAAYFSGIHAADSDYVCAMQAALSIGSYAEARRVANTYIKADFPTMQRKPPQMETYKKVHDSLKNAASDFCKNYFAWNETAIALQMQRTADTCEMLCSLFLLYEKRIWEEKKARGVLEFDDVREQLYRLLVLPDGTPSPFAETLSEQYDAVYIDEYQDVDFLQDRIFAIIGKNRRFMVGDIKQSIYGFRGSEPSIFASYRRAMPFYDPPKTDSSEAVCVFMSENFRCDAPVIDFANRVCGFLFSACEKSVGYRPEDDLQCSKKAPEKPAHEAPNVQTVLFEPYPKRKKGEKKGETEDNRPKREAVWIASEISRLLREEVLDNGVPIRPSDIAILVRSSAQGNAIAEELEKRNVSVSAPAAEDPLHSPVMTQTVNLLRAIDNPYRDIPLSEYLLCPTGGFSLEELTEIRSAAPMCKALYDAMQTVANTQAHPLAEKTGEWVTWLESWRRTAAVQPADRFLRLLYLDPCLIDAANAPELLLLYEQARIYQRTSWCGLYGFLQHITKLSEGKPVSIGGFQKADEAVTVMTIHHSKGLEFPVVFLAACGTRFNADSLKENLLFHRNVGFASKLYDPDTKENQNTILREAVKIEIHAEETEEAIRTLYVALTRARERLYVTATADGKTDTALANAAMLRRGSRYSILSSTSYLRWILAAMQEKAPQNGIFPCMFRTVSVSEEICGEELEEKEAPMPFSGDSCKSPTDSQWQGYREILDRQTDFVYPQSKLQNIPTKLAASKLRPDLLDSLTDEENERAALEAQIQLMQTATPSFESLSGGKNRPKATDIGTAMHAFLEFCDLSALPSRGVEQELERLVAKEFLSPETVALLKKDQLERFAQSELLKLVQVAERIYREQTFSLLLPLSELTVQPEKKQALAKETVFVQGSIDLLLQMKDGKLLLFDYKTDRIGEAERSSDEQLIRNMTEHHGYQLACYAHAVKKLFGKMPDEINIFSLPLGRAIPIRIPKTML